MDDKETSPKHRGSPERAITYFYRFEDAEFDEAAMTLRVGGQRVTVEPVPLALLAELLRRPNEILTHAELLDAVWEARVTVPHVLTSAINKLRKALGTLGAARIVNHARIGYRFVGELERIAVGRQPVSALVLAVGQTVAERNGFKLERRLNDPGGVEVWLARDAHLGLTRVFKFAAGGDDLASIKREYTVYRALLHELGPREDFARVLSANFAAAPYFLEYEHGGDDLITWAAQDDRLAAKPRPERIALFIAIAIAVAAAHGVGVLHKDLKPANVLIDRGPTGWITRLTDFGNSRLLDPDRLAALGITAMGMTVEDGDVLSPITGTPLYLAPELLAGKSPTTASDLYALGLMLYQLLVCDFRRPMSTGWQREIGDPLLVEDLVAATEGRPEDRLGSVNELIARLAGLEQRRAEAERVVAAAAAAASNRARLERLRARRPWVVAAAFSLVLGLAGCLWLFSQARDAQARAEEETRRATSINDFLNKDILQAAEVMRVGTNKTVSMFEGLRRASENASKRFAGQPRTEASIRAQIGEVYLHMYYATDARREFERAGTLLAPLVRANDPELLTARFGAVRCLVGRFMAKEALAELSKVEASAGPAIVGAENELGLRATRARVEVLMDAGMNKEALPAAKRLVELGDRVAGSDTPLRFEARQRLSEIYFQLGDKPHADELLGEIMRPPFGELGVGAVMYSRVKLQLGRQRINDGKLDEAERLLTDVRDTLTQAYGPNELHVGLANSELADLLQMRGEFQAAAGAARSAAEAFAASLGEQHSYVHISRANLALIEIELGQAADALRSLNTERPVLAKINNSAALLAGVDFARARALTDLGRPAESLGILKTLTPTRLAEASWGAGDVRWELQAEVARALMLVGQRVEGLRELRSAVTGMEAAGSQPRLIARYKALL